jgi:hypothetical protein
MTRDINKAPSWCSNARATSLGWVDPDTNELLISNRSLMVDHHVIEAEITKDDETVKAISEPEHEPETFNKNVESISSTDNNIKKDWIKPPDEAQDDLVKPKRKYIRKDPNELVKPKRKYVRRDPNEIVKPKRKYIRKDQVETDVKE